MWSSRGRRYRRTTGLGASLAVAAGAAVGLTQEPAVAGLTPRVAECSVECPDGTRRASFEAVVEGRGAVITGYRCETICEALLPCPPPNSPTIVDVDGEYVYSCAPLEGWSTIPAPGEIDFSFAEGWVPG